MQKINNKAFDQLLKEYYSKIEKLSSEANITYFNASISGSENDYNEFERLQLEINKLYSDKNLFQQFKDFKESGEITDDIKERELQLIYDKFAGNQFDENLHKEIIKLSTKIEKVYSTFRAEVNGAKVTDNEINDILKSSTDTLKLKTTWCESKKVGKVVAKDLIELVKLRNKSANDLGYENYHDMSLKLNEQNSIALDKLFDELDILTKKSFAELKAEIDSQLSVKFKIDKRELMPRHYGNKYFMRGPDINNLNIDKYFEGQDIIKITREYFNGINLNIDNLIEKSDLYEKDGKYQHAYCLDIDRSGDVRVVCSIKDNQYWMGTILHEYGHAVYDKNVSQKLPWQLRTFSHVFTSEAIAMLFGRLAHNPEWLKEMNIISEEVATKIEEPIFNSLRSDQLIFSRWVQVMYRFEKEMYSNPDQDLNELWWLLVEKYQLIKKPASRNKPDWASVIHIAIYPAYYHNYLLGELLASQLNNYITTKILHSEKNNNENFVGSVKVGDYLKHQFFYFGARYSWNKLIQRATGEELTPRYYVEQFKYGTEHEL